MKEAKLFALMLAVTRLKLSMTLSDEISLCGDLNTACIDGGRCLQVDGQHFACQCRDSSFNCEVKTSDLCYTNSLWDGKQTPQTQYAGFCLNNGRCATSVVGRHYCVCKDITFTGLHCELSMQRTLQLVGIPTVSPTGLNSTNELPSLAPSTANQSDVPNSEMSRAPSASDETSLTPSSAPSIGNSSTTAPTLSASPSTTFSPSSSTTSPSITTYPTSSVVPTATWFPTGSAMPTGTSLPTITAIPSTTEPTSEPSASPSALPSIVASTASPTAPPQQERQPIPVQPPFVTPVPSRNEAPVPGGKGGLNKGASVGIGLVALATVVFAVMFYSRRRRYSQAGRIADGDLELTNNYLDDDHDGWANQRPLTAGSRLDDGLL